MSKDTPNEEERRMKDDSVEIQVKEKIVTPIFLLLCVSVALNAIGLIGIGFVASDTNKAVKGITTVVADIEQETSPEAIEAQEATLNEVLLRVECRDRVALEEAINSLVIQLDSQGIELTPISVANNCKDVPDPFTTTTTEPN